MVTRHLQVLEIWLSRHLIYEFMEDIALPGVEESKKQLLEYGPSLDLWLSYELASSVP